MKMNTLACKLAFSLTLSEMLYNIREKENDDGMVWYRGLPLHRRINAKSLFILACGIDFQKINFLFDFRERINLLYQKLVAEKIITEAVCQTEQK